MQSWVERLARTMAILGGIVLTAIIIMTCISIIGRGAHTLAHTEWFVAALPTVAQFFIDVGIGPIKGDYELSEAGMAFSIFAFLPICQLHGAHATVDVFTSFLPAKVNAFIVTFWELILSAIMVLICVRLFAGLLGKVHNGEMTFILQFPVWWAYAISAVAAVVAAIVAVYTAYARVYGLVTGHTLLNTEGASH